MLFRSEVPELSVIAPHRPFTLVKLYPLDLEIPLVALFFELELGTVSVPSRIKTPNSVVMLPMPIERMWPRLPIVFRAQEWIRI